jgi:hypothetical protein
MSIVRHMLERLGFARLRDYGLILTQDHRVMTTRTRILDDGFGGRIVGWADDDLATMELGTWGEASAPPLAVPSAPIAPPRSSAPSPPVVQPVMAAPMLPAPPPPEPDEDAWEWEIAMARARAAAEEPPVAPPVHSPSRSAPHTTPQWLTKEPLSVGWNEDTQIRPQPSARGSEQMHAIEPRRRTIIPVPEMPVVDPELVRSHFDAVTRQVPRRFPRGSEQRIAAAANDPTSPTIVALSARERGSKRR